MTLSIMALGLWQWKKKFYTVDVRHDRLERWRNFRGKFESARFDANLRFGVALRFQFEILPVRLPGTNVAKLFTAIIYKCSQYCEQSPSETALLVQSVYCDSMIMSHQICWVFMWNEARQNILGDRVSRRERETERSSIGGERKQHGLIWPLVKSTPEYF